ncbi:hypothetical protein [Paraflavitalea soli]|nr:hypothetical protein [Paraflavitalea soli]
MKEAVLPKRPRPDLLQFDSDLAFNNCVFYDGDTTLVSKSLTNCRYRINGKLEINDFKYSDVPLTLRHLMINRSAYIYRSKLHIISIEDCQGRFGLKDNVINGAIHFLNLKNSSFDIILDTFKQVKTEIHVVNTVLKDISYLRYNSYIDMYADFYRDSLYDVLQIENGRDHTNAHKGTASLQHYFNLTFSNCYINADVRFTDNADTATVIFKNCHFGPNASLDIRADTVSFIDCQQLPATLNMQLKANNKKCWIGLNNTNIIDVNFVYASHHRLLFDSTADIDIYASTYENLLAKFRSENKKESYRRLDIEYKNYKASRGDVWNRISNWLNREWWNYGYSKGRVIGWTFALLGIFFVLNIRLWQPMQNMYPISQDHSFIDRKEKPFLYHIQQYIRILLYTVYIFFSIKIDLQKLKITTLPILLYFFLQFLVGLWCLFFIVNALLKIG